MSNFNISLPSNTHGRKLAEEKLNQSQFSVFIAMVYGPWDLIFFESLKEDKNWATLAEITPPNIFVFALNDAILDQQKDENEYSKFLHDTTGMNVQFEKHYIFIFCKNSKRYMAMGLNSHQTPEKYIKRLAQVIKFVHNHINPRTGMADMQRMEADWQQVFSKNMINGVIAKTIFQDHSKFWEIVKSF